MPSPELDREELKRLVLIHLDFLRRQIKKNLPGPVVSQEMTVTLDLLIRLYDDLAYQGINVARKRAHARGKGKCIKCFNVKSAPNSSLCLGCQSKKEHELRLDDARANFEQLEPDQETKN